MNSISCDYVRNVLVDYIENEIPRDQRFNIKRHLQACDECNNEYNGIRTMLGNANNSGFVEEPGQEFWNELPQRVLREVKREQAIQSNITNVMDFPAPNDQSADNSLPSLENSKDFSDAQSVNATTHTPAKHPNHPFVPVFALAATVALVVSAVLFWSPQKTLRFDSADFQAKINSDKELISLAHRFRSNGTPASRFGFANQATVVSGFDMGTMFSETVSYLTGDDLPGANENMNQMSMALIDNRLPKNLTGKLSQAQAMIQFAQINRLGSAEAGRQSMTRLLEFQQAYENYLRMNDERELTLFKTAIWSYNIGLAALAGDVNAVKQITQQEHLKPSVLVTEMIKINAPRGVLVTLGDIDYLVSAKTFDETQLHKLVSMVQQLRELLV